MPHSPRSPGGLSSSFWMGARKYLNPQNLWKFFPALLSSTVSWLQLILDYMPLESLPRFAVLFSCDLTMPYVWRRKRGERNRRKSSIAQEEDQRAKRENEIKLSGRQERKKRGRMFSFFFRKEEAGGEFLMFLNFFDISSEIPQINANCFTCSWMLSGALTFLTFGTKLFKGCEEEKSLEAFMSDVVGFVKDLSEHLHWLLC